MDYDRESLSSVGAHYDSVSDGWKFILGNNFHFGYYRSPEDTLEEATRNLITELAAFGPIRYNSSVLDIGCGIGEPALYLHEAYGCSVTGITISKRGVEIARRASAAKGCDQNVTFQEVNILSNELPSESFDVTWTMESSHLMANKIRLIEESERILKPGGIFLLCDMVSEQTFTAHDLVRWADGLAAVDRTFGKAKTELPAFYLGALSDVGFQQIRSRNVTSNILPTLSAWRTNILKRRALLDLKLSPRKVNDYLQSCDILTELMENSMLGYVLFSAVKKQR